MQFGARGSYLILLLMLCVIPGGAQTGSGWQWRNLTPATGPMPDARRNGVAVYNPAEQRVIVFGGGGRERILE
jgi:hypothetical protein